MDKKSVHQKKNMLSRPWHFAVAINGSTPLLPFTHKLTLAVAASLYSFLVFLHCEQQVLVRYVSYPLAYPQATFIFTVPVSVRQRKKTESQVLKTEITARSSKNC
jgi:hypothetical protein